MPAPQQDPATAAHPTPSPQEIDTGLICLLILARYFGIAADGEQLRHECGLSGKPCGDTGVLRAARRLGLKAGKRSATWSRLGTLPLPAIAPYTDGRYVILGQVDDERVLVQDPQESRPLSLSRQDFEAAWNGTLLLLTTRSRLRSTVRKFDVTWFLPAILKYRKLLGEVLLASFFLQLFALLTPLFFQVVTDKVLVHKGVTTLHVLALGMLVLSGFEALLGGLRTYLFSHTSNRIDVGLGVRPYAAPTPGILPGPPDRGHGGTCPRVGHHPAVPHELRAYCSARLLFYPGLFCRHARLQPLADAGGGRCAAVLCRPRHAGHPHHPGPPARAF